jgi:hypothetical protein
MYTSADCLARRGISILLIVPEGTHLCLVADIHNTSRFLESLMLHSYYLFNMNIYIYIHTHMHPYMNDRHIEARSAFEEAAALHPAEPMGWVNVAESYRLTQDQDGRDALLARCEIFVRVYVCV